VEVEGAAGGRRVSSPPVPLLGRERPSHKLQI
jgi:hypothetical protein